jgi:hypothetical protein
MVMTWSSTPQSPARASWATSTVISRPWFTIRWATLRQANTRDRRPSPACALLAHELNIVDEQKIDGPTLHPELPDLVVPDALMSPSVKRSEDR